jgi:hypothetical protein
MVPAACSIRCFSFSVYSLGIHGGALKMDGKEEDGDSSRRMEKAPG